MLIAYMAHLHADCLLTGFPLCTHRFFCGPYAQRSEKQSKQQRKRDRQGGAEEGSEEEEDDEEEEEGEEEGSSDGGDSGAGRQAGDHCFLVAAHVSYCGFTVCCCIASVAIMRHARVDSQTLQHTQKIAHSPNRR